MKKLLCKILTLGCHWWKYGKHEGTNSSGITVYCRICGKVPPNQWKIYKMYFLNRKGGKYVR
jgi:hypothetical protein